MRTQTLSLALLLTGGVLVGTAVVLWAWDHYTWYRRGFKTVE